jgi:hypothetical protein
MGERLGGWGERDERRGGGRQGRKGGKEGGETERDAPRVVPRRVRVVELEFIVGVVARVQDRYAEGTETYSSIHVFVHSFVVTVYHSSDTVALKQTRKEEAKGDKRTSVLRIPLLQVAQSLREELDGDIFVVGEDMPLRR